MATRVTKYDPRQTRAEDGKWTGGGGGGGNEHRVESSRQDAYDIARAGGHDETSAHAAGEHAAASERADIANEHTARAAGHLREISHAAMDAYHRAREQAMARVDESASALHAAHQEAAQALAELHAREHEDGIEETHGLADAFGETSTHLAGVGRAGDAESVRYEHSSAHEPPGEAPEHPGHDADPEALAAHHRDLADHQARVAVNEASFREHAAATQTSLERLHERQLHASQALREAQKEHDKAARATMREVDVDHEDLVHEAAFAHHERDEDTGDFADAGVREQHDHARRAAETALGHEASRRESTTSGFDTGDAHNALADETRQTARAIRQLSRVTGRPPRLGGKTRKSANRPDGAVGATVHGMAPRYKLKLRELKFVSLVDEPAQQTAKIRLLKRASTGDEVEVTAIARFAKITGTERPLAHFWAFTCTDETGQPYHDLQGDAISADDFITAAEEFMASGGAVDEMHDGQQTNQVSFAYPMDSEIAAAMLGKAAGAATKTSGLMVAIRPTPEQLAKLRSGDYTAVSIAGSGIRELVKAKTSSATCKSCGAAYGPADAEKCAGCGAKKSAGGTSKAMWSTADVDGLPDSSFLYIESGGTKEDGRTTPRSLRHFPYRDAGGKVDLPHLRNAIARIPQSSLPKEQRDKLQVTAERKLAAEHDKAAKRVAKQAVLTSSVDGHQHSLDLADPADEWRDQLSTSYQVSEGADNGHAHAWTYDATTGAITIADDSGHTHAVDATVPDDVRARAALNESGERCRSCGAMCEEGCRFCPGCGARMGGDGVPNAPMPDGGSGSEPAVVVVTARARAGISTPSGGVRTVKGETKEPAAMPDDKDRKITELEKANARLEKLAALTDAHRAHLATLRGSDADAFIGKSNHERDIELAEIAKANEVVYTSPIDGAVYRKNDDRRLIEMAKRTDEAVVKQRAAETAEREATFAKRGDEVLSHFAKGTKGNIRGRLMKAVNAEFTDPAEYEEAVTALKGMNNAMQMLGRPHGVSAGMDEPGANGVAKRLNAKIEEYAKANNLPLAVAYARATATDPEIRRLYDEAQAAGN